MATTKALLRATTSTAARAGRMTQSRTFASRSLAAAASPMARASVASTQPLMCCCMQTSLQCRATAPTAAASRCYTTPGFDSMMDEIEDANRRYEGKVKIQKWGASDDAEAAQQEQTDDDAADQFGEGAGWDVVSQTTYEAGDIVMEANILDNNAVCDSHTLQVDDGQHVL
eukprot:CAMPEP_0198129330 /NCGR_PEP_ID=MMETSP1442-20131203/51455_1 /TAXON_ID= /ORGANISM="Craspedostauros australis, Strain CCMP3328" /LENGTH=170 /DNA_ID=CAMNT_0043789701 /DNA_START=476 /DNA_END=985 /DNA_ORIENTATION=-